MVDPSAIVDIQPGDVLVAYFPREVSQKEAETIRPQLKELFPDKQILVMGGGATLGVLRGVELSKSAE